MRAGLGVEELGEVGLGAAAGVDLALGGAGGVELDGREAGDGLGGAEGLGGLGVAVDLCNQDVGLGLEGLGEGFPGGSEVLAVCSGDLALAAVMKHDAVRWKGGTYGRTREPCTRQARSAPFREHP